MLGHKATAPAALAERFPGPGPGPAVDAAVTGVACRLPGGADSLDQYWQVLLQCPEVTQSLDARIDLQQYYSPKVPSHGKTYCAKAALCADLEAFDAEFFGISPATAAFMDPQQRLLLEESWHALEHAGIPPAALGGSSTGVVVGISISEYHMVHMHTSSPTAVSGAALNMAAGRVAYHFNLQGAASAIDTACSSSLFALHMAVGQCLHEGPLALVAGVNAILCPQVFVRLCSVRALSPRGICASFDQSADGYGRAEGCAVLVLEDAARAAVRGAVPLARVRGNAVVSDGRSNGISAPNGLAQCKVMRRAMEGAGLGPSEVSYQEAHGTGTGLGDPIELEAIREAYGAPRTGAAMVVGTVKSCLGHAESAAGVAAVVKVVLALQHRFLPKLNHFQALNPKAPALDTANLRLPLGNGLPWDAAPVRRAGVSSFGFSGTNVHVILEEVAAPPPASGSSPAVAGTDPWPLCLSAAAPGALQETVERYVRLLTSLSSASLPALCGAALHQRQPHAHRVAVEAATPQALAEQLRAAAFRCAAAGGEWALVCGATVDLRAAAASQAFVAPAFQAALAECAEALRTEFAADGLTQALANARPLSPRQTLLAGLAVEYAFAALLLAHNARPHALVGYGPGHYVAGAVAGALPLPAAMQLAAAHCAAMHATPGAVVAFVGADAAVGTALALHTVAGGARVAVASGAAALPPTATPLAPEALPYLPVAPVPTEPRALLSGLPPATAPSIPILSGSTGHLLSQAPPEGHWAAVPTQALDLPCAVAAAAQFRCV